MIVIRYKYFRDGPSYATVEDEKLVVRYQEGTRVAREYDSPIGTMRMMEGTKEARKNRVTCTFRDGTDQLGRALEKRAGMAVIRGMRLLDHKEHLRVLRFDDVEALVAHDSEIREAEQALRDARERRRLRLQSAWRRATPLGMGEIEDRAKAELAEGRMAI